MNTLLDDYQKKRIWKVFVIYAIVLFSITAADGYSAFTCARAPKWHIQLDDNNVMMMRFQNMLTYYQHRCPKGYNNYFQSTETKKGGIGYTMVLAAVNLMKAFELGKIFRPAGNWLWADDHCNNSTINSVDCFTVPLSYCSLTNNNVMPSSVYFNKTDALDLIKRPCDSCTLAITAKKSLLWVFGQLMHYGLRLYPRMEEKVLARVNSVFPNMTWHSSNYSIQTTAYDKNNVTFSNKTEKAKRSALFPYLDIGVGSRHATFHPHNGLRCLNAAIHVRGGTPDFERIPVNGTQHFAQLKKYNIELKKYNATICQVYVGSDHIESTIFYPIKQFGKTPVGNLSRAFETKMGSMIFKSLPRFAPGPIDIEWQLHDLRKLVPTEILFQEFVEDLWIYSHVDIFLGSYSNIFGYVSGLRQAYFPMLSNNATCYMNTRVASLPLACMNSPDVLGFFQTTYEGFDGGSMFFLGGNRTV